MGIQIFSSIPSSPPLGKERRPRDYLSTYRVIVYATLRAREVAVLEKREAKYPRPPASSNDVEERARRPSHEMSSPIPVPTVPVQGTLFQVIRVVPTHGGIMGYPVYYSGAIEVQPPLSDAHAQLIEAFVNLEDSEDLRPTLEAIKSSEQPDLPYHGGQMYISEDRSKIEACQGEQRHGLRLWLVHLVKHFFIPQAFTLNGEISWDASDDPE